MGDRWIHDDDRVFEWIRSKSGLVRVADFIGIGCERDGELVAAFGYDHHQEWSCAMHWAAEPGGLKRRFLWKAFELPFVQWRYRCVFGVVQSSNSKSLRGAARLGFTERFVLAGAHPSGALHWLAMYAAECPWLDQKRTRNATTKERKPDTTGTWRSSGRSAALNVCRRRQSPVRNASRTCASTTKITG